MAELESKPPRKPNGIVEVKVDKAGRFTLPAEFRRYLEGQDGNQVFITTLDRQHVHIFAASVWRQRQEKLHEDPELADVVRRFLFTVHYYGADTAMDEQGRMVVPARLRELLKLENTTLALWAVSDRIEVMTLADIVSMNAESQQATPNDLKQLSGKGLI